MILKFIFYKFILIIICLVFFSIDLNADIIYLKNGRSIEGIIKSEDYNSIELDVGPGTIKFERNQVERIHKSAPAEYEAIRKKWEKQKLETQDKVSRRKFEEEHKPRKVEFSRESQGIVLDVMLNKKVEASLILDTGASIVVLRKNVAKKLGINFDRTKPDTMLQLADGRKVNAKYIVLESVKVENVEAKNVEAAILLDDIGGLSFGDGLLGMSFLKRFNFKVDYQNKKLTLERL